jgi:hypothetical protein
MPNPDWGSALTFGDFSGVHHGSALFIHDRENPRETPHRTHAFVLWESSRVGDLRYQAFGIDSYQHGSRSTIWAAPETQLVPFQF